MSFTLPVFLSHVVGIPLNAQESFGFEIFEITEVDLRGETRRLFLSCPLGTETRVSECRLIEGNTGSQMGVRCMGECVCVCVCVRCCVRLHKHLCVCT